MTLLDNGPVTRRPARTNWRELAACRRPDIDADLFFAVGNDWDTPANQARATQAKTICAGCPVRTECLISAREHGDQWAIAGGLKPNERQSRA